MNLYRQFSNQEEIDQQYNLQQAVDNCPRWFEYYIEESKKARSELECSLNIQYGPTVHETLDFYPTQSSKQPTLIFIHGGYWIGFSSKEFSFIARELVKKNVNVVITNYALCPHVPLDEITRQSRAVISWLYNNNKELNTDPNRIFASGHSAGGQQVGMLACTNWVKEYNLPADVIKGVIPLSGIFDLRPLQYSYLQPKLQLSQATITKQSPLMHLPDKIIPQLIMVGGDETAEFKRQSKTYYTALQKTRQDVDFVTIEGCHHFSLLKSFIDTKSILFNKIIHFINRELRPIKHL